MRQPPLGKQAPGFYRYKVGDFELTQIADGARTFPMPDGFVKNVPKDQALAAAEAAYMPKGMITVPFNPLVINTGSKLVLIDAGYGPNQGTAGQLPVNMAAAGIDPKAIDIVVLSHLHPDHINGIKTADGKLAFPNAEIMAPAADWAFWMSDENMAKAQDNAMMKGYFANTRKILADIAGKVTNYEWGKEVAPGITAIDARPHPRPHGLRGRLRLGPPAGAVGRHQHPRSCSCAIRIGTWRSTSIRSRRPRRATSSTTWRRPRRRSLPASTSPSPRSDMSRRTVPATGWCRSPGMPSL